MWRHLVIEVILGRSGSVGWGRVSRVIMVTRVRVSDSVSFSVFYKKVSITPRLYLHILLGFGRIESPTLAKNGWDLISLLAARLFSAVTGTLEPSPLFVIVVQVYIQFLRWLYTAQCSKACIFATCNSSVKWYFYLCRELLLVVLVAAVVLALMLNVYCC